MRVIVTDSDVVLSIIDYAIGDVTAMPDGFSAVDEADWTAFKTANPGLNYSLLSDEDKTRLGV